MIRSVVRLLIPSIALILAGVGAQGAAVDGAAPDPAGDPETEFTVQSQGKAIRVLATAPSGLVPGTAVVIGVHGIARRADEMRSALAPLASRGWLILVPILDKAQFPTFHIDPDLPRNLDAVFYAARTRFRVDARAYVLFGHSAGGQVAHRMAVQNPVGAYSTVISANSGWYLLPSATAPTCEAYARRHVIMLGDMDTDPNARALNRSPEAQLQGPHRFARGSFFFERARADAHDKGCPDFAWQKVIVPLVGHDETGMAAAAMQLPVFRQPK